MSTRTAPVVGFSAVLVVGLVVVLLLAGVGPTLGATLDGPGDRADGVRSVADAGAENPNPVADASMANATDEDSAIRNGDAAAQYKVSLDNVTVRTWLLRNSTVRNATVQEVVVENVTTPDGARENVTLTDVTVGEFVVERGRLTNVTATQLVVRNRSVLDVPGGDLFDPNVEDRTLERQWTRNATVAGVVIDRITVDAAIRCEDATLGSETDDPGAFDPQTDDDDPAIAVQNGTVEEALLIRGAAANWSVESVDESEAGNASLPEGCDRG